MTATMTGLDLLLDAAQGKGEAPAAAELLGWEALSLEPGYVRVRFTARETFCNGMGNIQGGFLAAMLDDTMGPALFTLLDNGQFAPTLELKVSFVRPASPGALVGEGRVVHKGKSIAFLEGTLSTEGGDLVATATATTRIFASNASDALDR
ncbi:MAG: PaaI family thioesterase [Dehalococcoidia bacterium]